MKMDQSNMRTFGALFAGSLVKKLGFLSLLFFSVNSAALDDGTWAYELNGDDVVLTGCLTQCPANLVIPATIDGKSVTTIGWQAFYSKQITSLSIPNTVEIIGESAFGFNDLIELVIPNSVLVIEDGAFRSNGLLQKVTFNKGLVSIGEYAFSEHQLTSLSLPKTLLSIGDRAFFKGYNSGGNRIFYLEFGENLESIGEYAFANNSIESVNLPSSLEVIGRSAFAQNNIDHILLNKGLFLIGDYAFVANPLGNEIVIPESVNSIGVYAFYQSNVKTVRFLGDRPALDQDAGRLLASSITTVIYCNETSGWPGEAIDDVLPSSSSDCDGDGVEDAEDQFPKDSFEWEDTDIDSIGNNVDDDDDNDGAEDALDAFPLDASETTDTDADGIGNNTDTDDDNDGAEDLYDAFPLDGNKTLDKNGSEITVIPGYGRSDASVAMLPDGGFVSIWGYGDQSRRHVEIYGQRFGANGVALGEKFLVNTDTYNEQVNPALTELADGGFVVAWTGHQSGSGQIYGQRFGANGEKIGDEFLVTADSASHTRYIDIAGLNNGGFVVSWPSYDRDGLYAQRFNANGLPDGEELLVSVNPENSGPSYPISSISVLPRGGFIIARLGILNAYFQYDGIYINVFGDNGTSANEEIFLATNGGGYVRDISVAGLLNGGLIVAWSDSQGNNGNGIYGQVFSPQGDPVGDKFIVNTHSNTTMTEPSIAALSDGGFFVAWESGASGTRDGSRTGIIGQRFTSNGDPVGSELVINTFTDDYQLNPSVATDAYGKLVAVWHSHGGDQVGIYAQRFSLQLDSDDDGVADTYDLFPLDPNETLDTDNDGIGDNTDTDGDNDGVEDSLDAFPFDPTETTDTDLDGIGNNADNDDDNDGIFDSLDTSPLDGANGFLFSIDGDNVTITGCFSACPAELVIPNTLLGKSVTGIGREAFYNSGILSVQIPEGIAEIGDGAFARNQLTSVIIPGSVKILEATFYDNYQLTSVTIGDGVNVIGRSVFNSTNLTSINIPNSVTTIGESAFLNNQLTSVTIPESVTSIGVRAFDRNKLTSITIPDSVTIIGRDAFQNNQLTNVIIPGSVTSLGRGAFSRNQLTNVTILEGVTVIKSGTFALNQLASVTIPESVASLSSTAFNDNIGVNNGTWKYFLISNDAMILGCVETCPPDLVIPESIDGYSVKIIGARAFRGNQLTSLSIPSSVTTVNAWAFGQNQFTQVSFLGARPVLNNNAFVQSLAISNISYCEDQAGWPGAEIESVTPVSSGQCDLDSDGVNDDNDAFPDDPTESIDTDGDGIGNNSDTDDDNDGVADVDDAYPLDPTASSDTDNDGVADNFDAFPLDASETLDHDGDGIGNNADTDDDNDGLSDTAEITIGTNPLLVDTDGDDFIDGSDAFPLDFFEWLDTDNDGIGNNTDLDDDSDGIEDALDRFSLIPYDPTQKLLDIDGNGRVGALTDALIILRYMFGFNGDALIDDAVAEDATRTSSEEIEAYLGSLMPNL